MATGVEAVTVAKAAVEITRGVRSLFATSRRGWPDAHEGLMELYLILDEWCQAADTANSNITAALALRRSRPDAPSASYDELLPKGPVATGYRMVGGDGSSNMAAGYLEKTMVDLNAVLDPPVPWAARWRRSTRRAMGRRTLRGIMKVYCPDLLESFDLAVRQRADWVVVHRNNFRELVEGSSVAVEELEREAARMTASASGLATVRDELRTLITDLFPLKVAD